VLFERQRIEKDKSMSTTPTTSRSSSSRMTRHRERRRQGTRCVTVDVSPSERDALVVRGYLSEESIGKFGVPFAGLSVSRCAVTFSRDAFHAMPLVGRSIGSNGRLMREPWVYQPDAWPAKVAARFIVTAHRAVTDPARRTR
jgi:hypothetical protein